MIGFGVIGAGRIGKIHVENLATRIAGAQVVALAEPMETERTATAAKFHIEKTFADYRDLLRLSGVEAVVVCAPTDMHYRIVLDAAAAGKQIFCEKPVDLDIERIHEINEAVGAAHVQFMVGFNRRWDPNFRKVHDIIAAGEIGIPEILRITSRDPAPPPENYLRASGGLFLDMTIHDFDMARFLMGSEVTEVYARGTVLVDPMFERVRDWDTAVVTLTFENGALGTIDNSRKALYGYDQRVEVFGSEGMVAIGNNTADTHVLSDRNGAHSSRPLNFFVDRYAESYRAEMQAFVDALQTGTRVPVSGEDGLQAVAIGWAAARSSRENVPVAPSGVSIATAG